MDLEFVSPMETGYIIVINISPWGVVLRTMYHSYYRPMAYSINNFIPRHLSI